MARDYEEVLDRIDAIAESEEIADDDFDWLLAQREHGDEEVRESACAVLAEILSASEIVDLLAPLLDDDSLAVREIVFDAMGEVIDEAEENGLLDLEGRPDWVEERGWVAPEDALRVYARLRATLSDEDEPLPVRLAALRSLGFAGERDELPTLIGEFLDHAEPAARQSAVVAAAAGGDSERWAVAITAALGDVATEVRTAAALAAGRLLLTDARPYLEDMPTREESSEEERLMAAISALVLSPPGERSALLERWTARGMDDELLDEAQAALEELEDWAEEEEE